MDKASIKALLAWLELARIEEIREHQAFVLEALDDLYSPAARADAKLALRLIDEELLSRVRQSSPRAAGHKDA
jgi:hypothetical protein